MTTCWPAYSVNVKPLHTVFSEPIFVDKTAVTDDRHAGQLQLLLAEHDQFTDVAAFLRQERFPAAEV